VTVTHRPTSSFALVSLLKFPVETNSSQWIFVVKQTRQRQIYCISGNFLPTLHLFAYLSANCTDLCHAVTVSCQSFVYFALCIDYVSASIAVTSADREVPQVAIAKTAICITVDFSVQQSASEPYKEMPTDDDWRMRLEPTRNKAKAPILIIIHHVIINIYSRLNWLDSFAELSVYTYLNQGASCRGGGGLGGWAPATLSLPRFSTNFHPQADIVPCSQLRFDA